MSRNDKLPSPFASSSSYRAAIESKSSFVERVIARSIAFVKSNSETYPLAPPIAFNTAGLNWTRFNLSFALARIAAEA
eukprot:31132-Pelagococcus_subviridis.AAC.3